MTRFTEGVAAELAGFIRGRRGRVFTSLEARRALPHLNWSSVRAHLYWLASTGRITVKRVPGQKARVYQAPTT